MNSIKPMLTSLVLLCSCFLSSAQYYELTRYADDNGLPVRIVRGAMQSEDGFLWIAGNNGLFKYDGKTFHPYYASLNDTTGLHGNKIIFTEETVDHKIWIGTTAGLHYLEEDHIHYVPLSDSMQHQAISLCTDQYKHLWVGTYTGLYVIKEAGNGSALNKPERVEAIPNSAIWGSVADRRGNIWVGTSKGSYIIYDSNASDVDKVNIRYQDGLTERTANIYRFQEYSDSLFIVDADAGLLQGILHQDSTMSISHFKDSQGGELAKYSIYYSVVDSDKNIWIATYRNYIKKYQLINGQLSELEIKIKNGWGGMAGHAISISEDVQKNIWVSNANGLFKLTKDQSRIINFPYSSLYKCIDDVFSVRAITEDARNNLWIATVKGLYRIRKKDLLERNCPDNYFFSNQFKNVWDLLIDDQNRLWVASEHGLSTAQLNSQFEAEEWFHFKVEDGLPHNSCHKIIQINASNYWLATYGGLAKVSVNNDNLSQLTFKKYVSEEDRKESLINTWVQELAMDTDGKLWTGTSHGLSQLLKEVELDVFQNFSSGTDHSTLSNNSIKNILSDRNGNLWIGTQQGLNRFEKSENNFSRVGRENGLPSEYILGLGEDSKGGLWVATTYGIFNGKYDSSCHCFSDIQTFSLADGLADNISNRNAFYIDEGDNVFIGSRKGLSIITNQGKNISSGPYNLALTQLESTQKKEQGFINIKNRIIDQEIRLAHFENSINLNYAVLDLSNPQFNQYRHQLRPLNQNWVYTDNNADLSYYNLPAGHYELVLDGANGTGKWSANPIHLSIQIDPPFFKSTMAYIIYALLLAAAMRLFYLWRVGKKLRTLKEKANLDRAILKEKVQLRRENAADFHDELGSRVTKISLYLTLAERSLMEKKDATSWFGKIRSNVTDLSGMFRDLLWVIDPEKDSLSETFFRLKEFGEELFQGSNLVFRTSGDFEKQTDKQLDAQTKKQVLLIFKEAMHNCLKYARAKRVELIFTVKNENASIELKDDGVGFSVKIKSKGRGLKNIKDRAQKINADLQITSGENGTNIRLDRIPYIRDDKDLELS